MTTRVPLALIAAVLALLGLAACGTTEPTSGSASTPPSAGSSGPIQLTDARGTAVTLPGPATRVVALEWNVAEHAVTLGVMPVGVADVAGYQKWAGVAPLDASVRDVGVRGEPSVDSIAALRPDLVLAADEVPAAALGQIQAFAPVVVVPGGNAADPLGQVKANTTLIGKALGRDAEAAEQIRSLDATIADGRNRLASQAGQRFVFADGYVEGGQVSIRPFTNGSQIGAVTTALGLVNAWTEPGDETYGLAQTDVEGLTRVGDATFLYIVNDGDGGDPFRNELAGNAVWRSLPFVATNRVDRLPDGIWVFGGPVSLQRYVDSAVGALTRT